MIHLRADVEDGAHCLAVESSEVFLSFWGKMCYYDESVDVSAFKQYLPH